MQIAKNVGELRIGRCCQSPASKKAIKSQYQPAKHLICQRHKMMCFMLLWMDTPIHLVKTVDVSETASGPWRTVALQETVSILHTFGSRHSILDSE